MGLLDEKSVRDFLIRHDCDALLKTKKFTDTQVYNKLAGIYDLDVRQSCLIKKSLTDFSSSSPISLSLMTWIYGTELSSEIFCAYESKTSKRLIYF
jgi:hypothetical protein